jgi:tetratricopeptide (TPR) repeat protein
MKQLVLLILIIVPKLIQAQSAITTILQGNEQYKHQQYPDAVTTYKKTADNTANSAADKAIANYNLGNTFAKQNNWQNAVDAYTKSLALQPNNPDAKYNLCYAKKKLEKQQQKNKQQNNKQQQQQQNQQQQNKQDNNTQQQSNAQKQSMPSKLTKQQAEQYLQALKEQEKKLMQQKRQGKNAGLQQAKDW